MSHEDDTGQASALFRDECTLAQALLERNAAAQEVFAREWQPRLVGFALKNGFPDAEALTADFVQDRIFVTPYWCLLGPVVQGEKPFWAVLTRALHHHAVDVIRKRRHVVRLSEGAELKTGGEHAAWVDYERYCALIRKWQTILPMRKFVFLLLDERFLAFSRPPVAEGIGEEVLQRTLDNVEELLSWDQNWYGLELHDGLTLQQAWQKVRETLLRIRAEGGTLADPAMARVLGGSLAAFHQCRSRLHHELRNTLSDDDRGLFSHWIERG